MNTQLHHLKVANDSSAMRQFLLSLIATTISIVLTFGTAAWLDNRKKAEAKREMVMMVLYDLATSMQQVETYDSMLHQAFEKQVAIAQQPELMDKERFAFIHLSSPIDYTTTVEQIFSTSIETINTIGNALFAKNISELYKFRKMYKEIVCDSCVQALENAHFLISYDLLTDFPFSHYIHLSGDICFRMKYMLNQSMKMMDVSKEELEYYQQKREDFLQQNPMDSIDKKLTDEFIRNTQRLEEAVEKGKSKN